LFTNIQNWTYDDEDYLDFEVKEYNKEKYIYKFTLNKFTTSPVYFQVVNDNKDWKIDEIVEV